MEDQEVKDRMANYESNVLSDALDIAFEKAGLDGYSFADKLKEDFQGEMECGEQGKSFLENLSSYGAGGMAMSGYIYDTEIKDFYVDHMDDLEDCLSDFEREIGARLSIDDRGPHATFVTYAVLELTAYDVLNVFDESLEEAVQKELSEIPDDRKDELLAQIDDKDIKDLTEDNFDFFAIEPEWKRQVAKFNLDDTAMEALSKFQPLPLQMMGAWLQLGLDRQARLFKEDPSHIHDEVYDLAQELAPVLKQKLEDMGADPSYYIRIKPKAETEAEEAKLRLGRDDEPKESMSKGIKM